MNRKLVRNIEKQKKLRAKKEEIEIELQVLEEEQIEKERRTLVENIENSEGEIIE